MSRGEQSIERQPAPDHVAVVGAGMAGLATAWFLQERGVRTTVLDRSGVGAGASWGNAGMLNPALTVPLAEPAALRSGLRGLLDPSSPIVIPPSLDVRLWKFLLQFARHARASKWQRSMRVFNELNQLTLSAYDHLGDSGVSAPVNESAPLVAAAATEKHLRPLIQELENVITSGGQARYELAEADELRTLEPALSDAVKTGILLHDQRYIDPPEYLKSLAADVRKRDGELLEGFGVSEIRDIGSEGVVLASASGEELRADAAVLANGAWLNPLAERFGVRQVIQAGRGYSFSVEPESMPTHPIYLPAQRLACNPLSGRFRVTGTMELRPADAPADYRRVNAMVKSARLMFSGVDWEARREEWVGSRPCTADGLPLIGRSTSPRVFIAGGHGMWGMVLGPATGRLAADAITGRPTPAWFKDLDPLR